MRLKRQPILSSVALLVLVLASSATVLGQTPTLPKKLRDLYYSWPKEIPQNPLEINAFTVFVEVAQTGDSIRVVSVTADDSVACTKIFKSFEPFYKANWSAVMGKRAKALIVIPCFRYLFQLDIDGQYIWSLYWIEKNQGILRPVVPAGFNGYDLIIIPMKPAPFASIT